MSARAESEVRGKLGHLSTLSLGPAYLRVSSLHVHDRFTTRMPLAVNRPFGAEFVVDDGAPPDRFLGICTNFPGRRP